MSREQSNWFAFSLPGKVTICCADCSNEINLSEPFLDHHSGICPACNVECAYLDWRDRKVQIVLHNAPPEFAKILRYFQENFDELEYVEVLSCFEEMANDIK